MLSPYMGVIKSTEVAGTGKRKDPLRDGWYVEVD